MTRCATSFLIATALSTNGSDALSVAPSRQTSAARPSASTKRFATSSQRPAFWSLAASSKTTPKKPSHVRQPHQQLRAQAFAESSDPFAFLKFSDFFEQLLPPGGVSKDNSYFGIKNDARGMSLLSLEGGDVSGEAVTTSVYMPVDTSRALTVDATMEKEQLVSEINTLAQTFETLQSSIDIKSQLYTETLKGYEEKIVTLQDENSFLEEGMRMLTVTLEKQENEIQALQEKSESDFDGIGIMYENKSTTEGELTEVKSKVVSLESENEVLRQRVRLLEVELSDVAFESRKAVPAAIVAVEQVVAPVVAAKEETQAEETVLAFATDAVIAPKAPSAPIPQHIQQQRQLDQLQMKIKEYEEERCSVRKLFGRFVRRGVDKVGKTLTLWRPIYLLLLDAGSGAKA
ncbi:predicted protein [Thalassiosira pseudonana CCMP1335]|uniref:Uncharacterized protein n=1 Tax=Thalassiosira pseudonana TaxID=35128 RepID=B5YN82_THAPS|nr:predicted protein [Thalassiosira pseudonana CCMP1335]ACI64589.1 predicted protein [Thalassiosira pseudonana CCMP1335]